MKNAIIVRQTPRQVDTMLRAADLAAGLDAAARQLRRSGPAGEARPQRAPPRRSRPPDETRRRRRSERRSGRVCGTARLARERRRRLDRPRPPPGCRRRPPGPRSAHHAARGVRLDERAHRRPRPARADARVGNYPEGEAFTFAWRLTVCRVPPAPARAGPTMPKRKRRRAGGLPGRPFSVDGPGSYQRDRRIARRVLTGFASASGTSRTSCAAAAAFSSVSCACPLLTAGRADFVPPRARFIASRPSPAAPSPRRRPAPRRPRPPPT